MKFKNLSRVERNMLTGLFCQFVTILLGFLMPRLYLTYYGSGVNGELNTIKQLFAYLYLLEALGRSGHHPGALPPGGDG